MKKTDWFIAVFFLSFAPLFFLSLGSYSLADFDEGWYAEIARNILVHRQPFILTFNGNPFTDHPPLGFIFMAGSFLIFGINEFGARFPSAISGLFSPFLLYLIGKNLFNRLVGWGAGLILLSSIWFLFRSRTGDLDIVFLFFYLMTLYMWIKIRANPLWIYPAALSFAMLLLIKAGIGLSIAFFVIPYVLCVKVRSPVKHIVGSFFLFVIFLLPFIMTNYSVYGWSYFYHLRDVAVRSGSRIVPDIPHIASSNTLTYLHYGIQKWYYPAILSFVGSSVFIIRTPLLIPLYVLVSLFLFGFLTNAKTEIWHLIILYPFAGIFISFFLYRVVLLLSRALPVLSGKKVFAAVIVIPVFFVSIYQIYKLKDQIRLSDRGESDFAYTAKYARNYREELYLDGHDLFPSVVFYARKKAHLVRREPAPGNSLTGIMANGPRPFLLLTEEWKLVADRIDPSSYTVVARKNGRMLLLVDKH